MTPISLKAEGIFHIGGFEVTNSLLLSFVVLVVLCVVALATKKRISLVPGKVQNVVEFVVEQILGLMEAVLGSRKRAEQYLPVVLTIFIFILTSNWLGLLPGVGSIGLNEGHGFVPLFRSPASDLNFTLALAVLAVLLTNIFGAQAVGFGKHLAKFFNFKNPLKLFIGLLEFVSELAKMISFSFRLFGNVFAGEVLLTIVFFLAPYVVPLPFLFLEIFVGFIQAFVFAMLTMVFLAIHTTAEEH